MGGVSTLTDAQSYEIEQYCAHRPEYPASLWALFTTYHHGPLRIAHDIGTGYGNGIEGLLRSLKLGGNSLTHAILTEPKSFLLDAARIRLPPLFPHTTFAYRNKKGEGAWDSPLGIATGQLDLVMSCEAIHWTILTPTLAHINQSLRPGGTFGAVVYAPLPNVVDNAPATASLRRVVELHVSRLVSEDWMDEGWKRCMRQLYSGLDNLPLVDDQWIDVKLVEVNNLEGWWCPDGFKSDDCPQQLGITAKLNGKAMPNRCGNFQRIVVPVDASWRRTVSSSEWLKQMLLSFRLDFSDSSWASAEWKGLEQALQGQQVQLEWPVHVLLARKR